MDHSRRNPDRADPLRSLSQAIARGASQVLREAVRQCAQREPSAYQGGERASSLSDGGRKQGIPLDLTARCEHCHSPLPPMSTAARKFCDKKCQSAYFNGLTAAALREEKQGRSCILCGEAIPAERRADALYCKSACRERHCNPRKRLAITRACPHCGDNFRPSHKVQAHCSRECRTAALREAAKRPCEWCGNIYRAPSSRARFCCMSCSSQANWSSGKTRVLPWCEPPHLTAARLDRLLAKVSRSG